MDFYNSASFKRAFPNYKTKSKHVQKRSSMIGVWKEKKEIEKEKAEHNAKKLNQMLAKQEKRNAALQTSIDDVANN